MSRPHPLRLVLTVLFWLAPAVAASDVEAMAPEAAAALAGRISSVLPVETGWDPLWDAGARAWAERELAAMEEYPEASVAARRFRADVPAAWSAAGPSETQRFEGTAAWEFAAAARALSAEWSRGEYSAVSARIGRLCIAACDLADPYQTTSLIAPETSGARAAFVEGFAPADLTTPFHPGDGSLDPFAVAVELARTSASRRATVEEAAARGDWIAVAAARRELLADAQGAAASALLWAWIEAGSPRLDGGGGWLRLFPNPTRGAVHLAFRAGEGPARLDLYDVAGRRVLRQDLASEAAGSRAVTLNGEVLQRLPAGVYLARISGAGARLSGRLVLLQR